MQDDQKSQITKATEGLHYCDLIMTTQEAEDLRALVKDLQVSGKHPGLSGVFNTILEETWSNDEPWPTFSSGSKPALD